MKGFIAACIAVGLLWVLDAEMYGGRHGDVVKKAMASVLPKMSVPRKLESGHKPCL